MNGADSVEGDESAYLEPLQAQASAELREHLAGQLAADLTLGGAGAERPSVERRLGELLLLLPALRSFRRRVLVDLFFSGLIGNVQVENVIPFILKMDVLQIFGKPDLLADCRDPPPPPSY